MSDKREPDGWGEDLCWLLFCIVWAVVFILCIVIPAKGV